ncbi:MAG: type VI secretion protein IcmF/TssM N-terminal domain-containing protein, partial [Myxococcota bacterium]
MGRYVFGVIALAILWGLWFLFAEQIPLALPCIGSVLVLFLFFVSPAARVRGVRWVRRAVVDLRSKFGTGTVPPKLRSKEREFRSKLEKARAALGHRSTLGFGGGSGAQLPWVLMLGPSGSGKTAAIRRSGLGFFGKTEDDLNANEETKGCDWWLSNRGVLLDTTGRWASSDDHRDEWHCFLQVLTKKGPRRPLHGIVVAISAAELLGRRDELRQRADKIR